MLVPEVQVIVDGESIKGLVTSNTSHFYLFLQEIIESGEGRGAIPHRCFGREFKTKAQQGKTDGSHLQEQENCVTVWQDCKSKHNFYMSLAKPTQMPQQWTPQSFPNNGVLWQKGVSHCNSIDVYSEISHIHFDGTYSQVSQCMIAALKYELGDLPYNKIPPLVHFTSRIRIAHSADLRWAQSFNQNETAWC